MSCDTQEYLHFLYETIFQVHNSKNLVAVQDVWLSNRQNVFNSATIWTQNINKL